MSLLLLLGSGGGGTPPDTIVLPTVGDVSTINGPAEVETTAFPQTLTLPTLGDVATLNAPNVFEYEVLSLPSMGGGPVAGGLWIENTPEPAPTPTPGEPIAASDTLPDPRVRVRVVDADTLAEIAELDEAKKRQWQTVVGDSGTGLAILENDDVDLASASYGRLLRFELDGRAVFLASIERKVQVVLSQDEEVGEETEIGGRGILALFEDFVVYPEAGAGGRPFSDQRILNWTSADFDDSGWRTVIVGQKIGDVHAVDPNIAKGFPDAEARVLWAHSSSGAAGAGAGGTPPGLGYFRAPVDFEVPTDGWDRLFLSADDGVSVNVDGVQIFAEARLWFHLETKWVDLYLSAGPHQISALGENLDNGNLAGNSAWILLSLIEIEEDGDLGTVILRTGADWKGVAYPPKPPGMTPGRVIRILLEEAQARGGMIGWTLGFTDTADSHGQAWADDPELAFQCGLDGFSVLRQIAETYCEIDVAPAQKVLYAYAGGYGEETGITYETGVSILALSHEGSA